MRPNLDAFCMALEPNTRWCAKARECRSDLGMIVWRVRCRATDESKLWSKGVPGTFPFHIKVQDPKPSGQTASPEEAARAPRWREAWVRLSRHTVRMESD